MCVGWFNDSSLPWLYHVCVQRIYLCMWEVEEDSSKEISLIIIPGPLRSFHFEQLRLKVGCVFLIMTFCLSSPAAKPLRWVYERRLCIIMLLLIEKSLIILKVKMSDLNPQTAVTDEDELEKLVIIENAVLCILNILYNCILSHNITGLPYGLLYIVI